MQAFFTLLSKIHKNQFSPFYLLSGTESYYINAILSALTSKLVQENNRDFDYTLFFGKDANASKIIETAKRYPVMAKYNLVVVKEAQEISTASLDELALYAVRPANQSIVIICYMQKAFDKRKKLFKIVEKTGEILTVKPLYEDQIPKWVKDHAKSLKLDLTPTAIQLLSSYIGANLERLSKELKKLKSLIRPDETIDEDLIEKYVGISKKFNNFELQKAIGLGKFSLAFRIIQYLNRNQKAYPLILTLSSLHSYFIKLLLLKGIESPKYSLNSIGISPYFLEEYKAAARRFNMRQIISAMGYIFEADLKSKGIKGDNLESKEILETLLLRLFAL